MLYCLKSPKPQTLNPKTRPCLQPTRFFPSLGPGVSGGALGGNTMLAPRVPAWLQNEARRRAHPVFLNPKPSIIYTYICVCVYIYIHTCGPKNTDLLKEAVYRNHGKNGTPKNFCWLQVNPQASEFRPEDDLMTTVKHWLAQSARQACRTWPRPEGSA